MADSSLWHRLNPFHPRPPSSLRRQAPSDSDERPSSIDTSVPHLPEEDYRSKDVYTPLPSFNPASPSKSVRTPSILRSLAHHPSISALRPRSKKAKKDKTRPPLPPLPGRESISTEYDIPPSPVPMDYRDSPSPKKVRKRAILKESKSLPQKLRTSGETTYPRSSAETDPFPPLPSPAVFAFDNVTKVRPKKHRREESRASIVKRKPVPSATPDITIVGADVTPESVKIRRKRFQFDFSVDGRPPSMNSLSSVSAARRRAMSTGEVDVSPTRPRAQSSRHLSSPAPPSPFRHQFASSHHPFTTQHPHPIPLTSSPRPSYDKSSSQYGSYDPDAPLGPFETGPILETQVMNDAFDMLVGQEEIPSGTPGGKKADLRRGALLDGAKHETNAIRFFSRDMYEEVSTSDTSSSFLTTSPISAPQARLGPQDQRSESPFEVKLSPMVTKRMSLDAFGTPTPPLLTHSTRSASDIEELAEDDDEENDLDSVADVSLSYSEKESPVPHTTLSTIQEASFSSRDIANASAYTQTPGSHGVTQYFTPASETLDNRGLPLPSNDSPFLPLIFRQHLSCPPLPINEALLTAHSEHAQVLVHELECARNVIGELEDELKAMKVRAEEAVTEDEHERAWLNKAKELEGLPAERDEKFDEINGQIESQAKEHGIAVTQLRAALEENEGYFDTLQQAHDELADRLAELEADHAQILIERKIDAETLQQAHDEVRALKQSLKTHEGKRVKVEAAIVDLQSQLHQRESSNSRLQAQLDAQAKQSDEENVAHQALMTEVLAKLKIKEERVLELEDLLRDGLERESEYNKLVNAVKLKDERIIDLQNRQTDRHRLVDSLREQSAEKDGKIAEVAYRLAEIEKEKKRMEKEAMAALKSISAKDLIIGVLRDKLSTADFEKDELIARNRFDQKKADEKIQEMELELEKRQEMIVLANEKEEDRARQVAELKASMGFMEISQKERENELKDATNIIQEYRAEKTAWEDERAELTIKLEDAEIVAEEVETLREQLDDQMSDMGSLKIEVENLHLALDTANTTLNVQDQELEYLRRALIDAEDAAESLGDGFLRRARDAEREAEALRQELGHLANEAQAKDDAVRQAVGEAEMEKVSAADSKSRLQAFTAEIDRLSLSNAELKKEVDDTKRTSSSLELKLLEMGKKIATLKEDKELLNVALDSKQTELVLLQRQLGQGTPKTQSRPATLAASTSRLARPSMGMSTGGDITPVPKALSKSVSHTSLRTHSRGGSVTSTPTPSTAGQATPRARPVTTPTPMPLGASSRHNRTPEKKALGKKMVPIVQPSNPAGVKGAPTLERRSSLPVMRGTSMDLGRKRMSGVMGRLSEEDGSERV